MIFQSSKMSQKMKNDFNNFLDESPYLSDKSLGEIFNVMQEEREKLGKSATYELKRIITGMGEIADASKICRLRENKRKHDQQIEENRAKKRKEEEDEKKRKEEEKLEKLKKLKEDYEKNKKEIELGKIIIK